MKWIFDSRSYGRGEISKIAVGIKRNAGKVATKELDEHRAWLGAAAQVTCIHLQYYLKRTLYDR